MPDETPRLDLFTYSEGDTDWSHTDTVEAVDEHAIVRGPIEDRPDEGEYDDELYLATDQRITWRWDADDEDWEPIGGLGDEDKPVPGMSHYETISTGDIGYTDDTQTIYVSETGDDSNSGESADDAFATLSAAFEALTNASIARDYVTHSINIPAGETIVVNGYPQLHESYRPYVRVYGDPDNPPTIDVQSGNKVGIGIFNGAKFEFRDVTLDSTTNPPDRMIRASEGSVLYLRGNTTVTGAAGRQIDIRANSYGNVMDSVVIDGNGADGMSTHSASFGKMAGTIQNCGTGLFATRNGLMSASGTIDNCETGVKTRDGPQFKLLRTAITNCTVGVSAGRDSLISCIEIDWTGTSTNKETRDATGKVRETTTQGEAGETWFGVLADEELTFRDGEGNRVITFDPDGLQVEPTQITVNVPSDYSSLNEALNQIGRLLPTSTDSSVTINIESGHEIAEPIYCEFGDWSHVEIVAEDDIVNVSSDFPADADIFLIRYGKGPVVRTLIDANGYGRNGMWLRSNGIVQNTSGILNAGLNGIKVENVSIANVYASDWSGAARNGVRVTRSSHATLGGAGGSTVNDVGEYGLRVDRGSTTRATEITANNCGLSGVFVREGGTVTVDECSIDSAGTAGIEVVRNGRISAYMGSITGSFGDAAVKVEGASTAHLQSATIDSTGSYAVWCRYGSTINTHHSTVTSDQTHDILVRNGGIANMSATETSSSTDGKLHENDIYRISPNTINGEGIVFAENFETST